MKPTAIRRRPIRLPELRVRGTARFAWVQRARACPTTPWCVARKERVRTDSLTVAPRRTDPPFRGARVNNPRIHCSLWSRLVGRLIAWVAGSEPRPQGAVSPDFTGSLVRKRSCRSSDAMAFRNTPLFSKDAPGFRIYLPRAFGRRAPGKRLRPLKRPFTHAREFLRRVANFRKRLAQSAHISRINIDSRIAGNFHNGRIARGRPPCAPHCMASSTGSPNPS